MMLRESSRISEVAVNLGDVATGVSESNAIPHAEVLGAFAEAVVRGDRMAAGALRETLRAVLGPAGLVDAACIIAAFHGFPRIADAIGIPYTTAAAGQDAPDVREAAGVNAFPRVRGEAV